MEIPCIIELDLPMRVRRVVASDAVKADVGKVALERGPVVYAPGRGSWQPLAGTSHTTPRPEARSLST